MVRMQKRIKPVLEGVVIGAIVLVLVQTFLEDFATLIGWSWNLRRALIFTGFAFDVFFTIEFSWALLYTLYHVGLYLRFIYDHNHFADSCLIECIRSDVLYVV